MSSELQWGNSAGQDFAVNPCNNWPEAVTHYVCPTAAFSYAGLMFDDSQLGAASCVCLLPGALLQAIVELAEPEGATRLRATFDAAAPPQPAAGPSVFGPDLAAIASMVG